MKGICHKWSRGRHFSPSLPGDRYLNLGSKSDHRAEISGNIVWYDALAPRPEVLRPFSALYANCVFCVIFFFCRRHKFQELIHSAPSKKIKKVQIALLFKFLSSFQYLGFLRPAFLHRTTVMWFWSLFSNVFETMKLSLKMGIFFKILPLQNGYFFLIYTSCHSSTTKSSIDKQRP